MRVYTKGEWHEVDIDADGYVIIHMTPKDMENIASMGSEQRFYGSFGANFDSVRAQSLMDEAKKAT